MRPATAEISTRPAPGIKNWKPGRYTDVLPRMAHTERHPAGDTSIAAAGYLKLGESADKPGSVADNHSSGTAVTGSLEQPTRKRRGPRHCFPIWSCSRWGLPCRSVLPPARCALTAPFHPYLRGGGIFSVALSVGSRPPGVTWHPALWSPDFPPPRPSAKSTTTKQRLSGQLSAQCNPATPVVPE